MPDATPENRIYLTAKTRMTSEARARATARLFHYLISWYSFCLIVLSIGQITDRFDVAYGDILAIVLSIGLLSMSLFTYGEKYHERADQYRSCYLKLQELYGSALQTPEKMKRYAQILDQYENQRDDDYDDMLFDCWIRGQSLENSRGPVSITWLSGFKVALKRLIRFSLFASLFAIPFLFAIQFGETHHRENTATLIRQERSGG